MRQRDCLLHSEDRTDGWVAEGLAEQGASRSDDLAGSRRARTGPRGAPEISSWLICSPPGSTWEGRPRTTTRSGRRRDPRGTPLSEVLELIGPRNATLRCGGGRDVFPGNGWPDSYRPAPAPQSLMRMRRHSRRASSPGLSVKCLINARRYGPQCGRRAASPVGIDLTTRRRRLIPPRRCSGPRARDDPWWCRARAAGRPARLLNMKPCLQRLKRGQRRDIVRRNSFSMARNRGCSRRRTAGLGARNGLRRGATGEQAYHHPCLAASLAGPQQTLPSAYCNFSRIPWISCRNVPDILPVLRLYKQSPDLTKGLSLCHILLELQGLNPAYSMRHWVTTLTAATTPKK